MGIAAANSEDTSILDVLDQTGVFTVAGAIILATLTYALGVSSARRKERRERYSDMSATLAAWAELPFRIRRRTSDEPATLTALVAHVTELQECLRRDQAYLRAECVWLAERRDEVQTNIQRVVGPWINEAWTLPPCSTPASMNIGKWGPEGLEGTLNSFSCELKWRFGWRWMVRRVVHRLP
ncbi:hypothetical protein [Gemmatimonas sp.]|uniref:hypothetical protein n=1 Tax=Gemmatimonas sp. TaxID=1962908 RepID=UPI003564DEE0